MDNKVEMRAKKNKRILILAIVFAVVACAVFCAALLLNKREANVKKADISAEITQILDTREIVAAKDSNKLAEFSAKVSEISGALDKIENSGALDNKEVKTKFDEAKASFAVLQKSGELAGLIAELSSEDNDRAIEELKSHEESKDVSEALDEYRAKLGEFKTKYAGNGEGMQAVLDYSELEKLADKLKKSLEAIELSEVTSDEIAEFYAKIEELRDIISR